MPKPAKRKPHVSAIAFDVTLACVAVAIGVVMILIPPESPAAVVFWLVVLFAAGVQPILHFLARVWRSRTAAPIAISSWACLVIAFGINVWPTVGRHVLTDQERVRFQGPIKDQLSARDEIVVACPQQDEGTCVYAAQFVNIFREAGWRVRGNAVERGLWSRPVAGVFLINQGTGEIDPNDWKSGLWSRITPSFETVRDAFIKIGVESDSMSDKNLPDKTLMVYFGPEKPDAAAPTALTATMEKVEEYRRANAIPRER